MFCKSSSKIECIRHGTCGRFLACSDIKMESIRILRTVIGGTEFSIANLFAEHSENCVDLHDEPTIEPDIRRLAASGRNIVLSFADCNKCRRSGELQPRAASTHWLRSWPFCSTDSCEPVYFRLNGRHRELPWHFNLLVMGKLFEAIVYETLYQRVAAVAPSILFCRKDLDEKKIYSEFCFHSQVSISEIIVCPKHIDLQHNTLPHFEEAMSKTKHICPIGRCKFKFMFRRRCFLKNSSEWNCATSHRANRNVSWSFDCTYQGSYAIQHSNNRVNIAYQQNENHDRTIFRTENFHLFIN